MTQVQRDAYGDASTVSSDALGMVDRDNRNHRKKQQIILEHTHADAGDRVLEVGCGHGLHAVEYAQRFHYTGIDISESLVEETRKRVDAVTDSWGVMQMDAHDLAWDTNRFDAVVGTAILHHLDRPREALLEWQRVVRPGGSVTLMEPNYLFPKDFVSAHLVAEERNKTNMAPWRLRRVLDDVAEDFTVTPRIHTPPWFSTAHGVYDRVDATLARVPLARWTAQMLLIQIRVPSQPRGDDSRRT